jgi:hypothetical protein
MRYKNIVLLEGKKAEKALRIGDKKGYKALLQYLKQFYYNQGVYLCSLPARMYDIIIEIDNFIILFNETFKRVAFLKVII